MLLAVGEVVEGVCRCTMMTSVPAAAVMSGEVAANLADTRGPHCTQSQCKARHNLEFGRYNATLHNSEAQHL